MAMARVRFVAMIGVALALTAPRAALASGGGSSGAGEMPSATVPEYDPAEDYQRGMTAYQAGKFKDAARNFDRVVQAPGVGAGAWKMLALSRSALGDAKGAAKAFEHALKLDPAPVDVRRDYALALAQIKQTDKAAAELAKLKTRAEACQDSCPDAADLKAAVARVESALAPPAAPPTVSGGGGSAASPGAMAQAAPLLSAAQGDSAYVEAVSLINEHRYAEALTALGRAEAAFGPHPDVLTYQGYVWRKLGRQDLAEHYYRAALAIAPDHRGASEYYGELKVLEGDLPAARALLGRLDRQCAFGCAEAEDLRRWIARGGDPAS